MSNGPAWLTAKVDQRLALMSESLSPNDPPEGAIITMMLSEPGPGDDPDRWERSCDNCGTYCPPGTSFYTGHTSLVWNDHQVLITFGACANCRED